MKRPASDHRKIADSLVDKVHLAERTHNKKDAIYYGTLFNYHRDMSIKLSGDSYTRNISSKEIYDSALKTCKSIYKDMSFYKKK